VDSVARSALEDLVRGYIGPGDAQQAVLDAIETKIGHPSARDQARYLAAFGRGLTVVPELDAYIK